MYVWPRPGPPPKNSYEVKIRYQSSEQERLANATAEQTLRGIFDEDQPTFAVLEALRHLVKQRKKLDADAVVGYDLRTYPSPQHRTSSPLEAVNTDTVEEYLQMLRSADKAPPKNYTIFWGATYHIESSVYWMTLQARHATEAFLISQAAAAEFDHKARDYISFSIYEGWHKPFVLKGCANLERLPSVLVDPAQAPPQPRAPKHKLTQEVTEVGIDCWNTEPDGESRYEDMSDVKTVAVLAGNQKNVSREINEELLEFLLGDGPLLTRAEMNAPTRHWPRMTLAAEELYGTPMIFED